MIRSWIWMDFTTHSTRVMYTAMLQPQFTGRVLSKHYLVWLEMYRCVCTSTMHRHVQTFINAYVLCTCIYKHSGLCIYRYMHINRYMYIYVHVHECLYNHVHVHTLSVPCSDVYVPICHILSRWVGFQMAWIDWILAKRTIVERSGRELHFVLCSTSLQPGKRVREKPGQLTPSGFLMLKQSR